MNCGSFNDTFNSFLNPGKNCSLDFLKNSFKNKTLKFSTWPPEVPIPTLWVAAFESENINSSGSSGFLNDVIPLNPRIHPSKVPYVRVWAVVPTPSMTESDIVPKPVYVTISSSNFNKP